MWGIQEATVSLVGMEIWLAAGVTGGPPGQDLLLLCSRWKGACWGGQEPEDPPSEIKDQVPLRMHQRSPGEKGPVAKRKQSPGFQIFFSLFLPR